MKHLLPISAASLILLFQVTSYSQCAGTQTFNFTGSNQSFVVPSGVTTITAECYGAKGGNGNVPAAVGGSGAYIKGDITVTPGETLTIIAGGMGENGVGSLDGGGGGGGAFVIRTSGNVPLIIAGGGGGGCYAGATGFGGSATTTGGAGGYVPTLPGQGGYSDNGGGGGTGAGGGGWNASGTGNNWATGGIMQGGAGGISDHPDGDGGFGGGGASYHGGGGGGGYSGGGGGTYTIGGGGGGSYNTGANQTNTAGVNTGNGYIVLSWGTNTFVSVSETICFGSDFTFPDGSTQTNITSQVVQSSLLTDMNGCDSTVETTVDVYPQIDNGAVQAGLTITADASTGSYEWLASLDGCTTFTSLTSETNQAFTATADGSYAVVVSENGCSDTSACFTVLYFKIDPLDLSNFTVSPNPANENVFVSHAEGLAGAYTEIVSVNGQVLKRILMGNSNQTILSVADLSRGVYFVRIVDPAGTSSEMVKLVVR